MNPWLIASVAGLIFAGGQASKDVGQGVDNSANPVLKVDIGLAVGFVVLKKMKVI